MDEVIFEEFKGTGNMEVVLDKSLSEKRIFPAIDVKKSGTRKEELLLSKDELEAVFKLRQAFSSSSTSEMTERIMATLSKTKNNEEFVKLILQK